MDNIKLNIKKNELLRQFEYKNDSKLIKLEYSEQGRNIFLTRLEIDKNLENGEKIKAIFLESILDLLSEEDSKVVPTCPNVAKFFRKHRLKYKHLLPVGINI